MTHSQKPPILISNDEIGRAKEKQLKARLRRLEMHRKATLRKSPLKEINMPDVQTFHRRVIAGQIITINRTRYRNPNWKQGQSVSVKTLSGVPVDSDIQPVLLDVYSGSGE